MALDSDDRTPDAALHVRFQMLSIYQPYDSANPLLPDGKPNPRFTGNPVYRDIPHIEISVPSESGLCLNRIVNEVRPDHKARFKAKWEMFQLSQGDGDQIIGTKLSEWPGITRSRAEELRAMKYYVVEQIAAASDAQVQGLGMDGVTLRNKAVQYLKMAKETAHAERQAAEIAKRDAELNAANERMAKMEEQLRALAANQPTSPAAKRGRPPKVKQEAEPQGA